MNRQRTNKTSLVLFFILCILTVTLISYFTDQTIYNNSLFNKISISIYLGRANKQSLDLISLLKDDLKSINDSFIDYERIHNDIVFNRSSNRRVLFYRSSQVGYGNNIYSMLSAFMIAVLTESALLIDWPEIDKYIEPPFNLSFSRFHDSSELDFNQKSPPIFVVHPETENSFRREKRLLIDISLPSSYYSRLYLSHYTAYFFDLCLNPAHGVKLAKLGLVRKDTVIRALESLQDLNVIESQKIEYLMLIGFEFAGNALNKHWLLKPYLRDKISSYYENEFIGTFVIGIQLRLYYLTKSDLRTFFSCALEIERQKADIIQNRTVRWFVSTDKSDVLDEIEREFGDKIIMGYGKLGHVNKQPDAYERALFDVEMLARCDELILTGGSTFGLVASFMSQKRPFYVEGKRHSCGVLSLAMPPIQFDGHSSI